MHRPIFYLGSEVRHYLITGLVLQQQQQEYTLEIKKIS